MNKERILSFEMSQKVSDSEISGVSAGEGTRTVEITFDSQSGSKHMSFDHR